MINIRRLKAVAVKEFIHIMRDWRSLLMAIAIPILLIMLFGYALNMDLKNVPVSVVDFSNTYTSRELISMFDGSEYFSINHKSLNIRELRDRIISKKSVIGIVIPKDFDRSVKYSKETSIQVLVDGSDANIGTLSLNYVQNLSTIYNYELMKKRGAEHPPVNITKVSIEIVTRAWYNQGLVSTYMIVPGILAIVMVVIASMLASVTVAKEWENGTMEQLISTPVRRLEFTFGKVIPLYLIGLTDVLIAVVLGKLVFNVPMRGSPAMLFIVASTFLCGVLFYGLFLSIVLKKQVLANQIALVSGFLPTMILSGFVFTIANMPKPIQLLTYIFPARYFISMLKGIYLKGIGLDMMAVHFILLFIYMSIMMILSNIKLSMRID